MIFRPTWCHPQYFNGGQEMFDWNRAWYPIAPLEYLNADAPNAVKLLGKRMVLWCSNQDTWIHLDYGSLEAGGSKWMTWGTNKKSIDYPIFLGTEFWPISSYDSFFLAWLIGKVVKVGSYTGLLRVVSLYKGDTYQPTSMRCLEFNYV